jgi:mono/diheme cytochrome c family protein
MRTFALMLSALLCLPLVALAEPPSGAALYQRHCASCHGRDGHGDGPLAATFVRRPRDLRDGGLAHMSPAELAAKLSGPQAAPLAVDIEPLRARAADTEALVAFLHRLPEVDWRAWDAGEPIFSARCAPCHGAFGRSDGAALPPGVKPPRDLSAAEFQQATSDAALLTAVRHGRAGMPGLTPRLTDTQASDVATFVRLLSPSYTTYAQYCASCHGEHGLGRGSFGESQAAPTVIFDRAYFARRDPELLRRDVWHMLRDHQPAMPHTTTVLSAAAISQILAYLNQAETP